MAAHVEFLGTLGSQETGICTSIQALGQDVEQSVGQTLGGKYLVELLNHRGVVALGSGINGNHTRGIAYAQHEFTSHLPVYVACQRGQILDIGDVLLVVEDGLVEVRNRPAQGDIIVEQLRQLGSGLTRIGVTPSAEGHQNLLLLVESHIAVHHGREADSRQRLYFAVVLLLNILAQVGIAVLQTVPYSFGRVGPQAVNELVFPLV